ncbi:MAG: class I SAM-dependent methyltransferase [Spirochaetales bacterium]|nr:MAG: class I SAM-dependent methyltransferase [Spirochaetales bacterium]
MATEYIMENDEESQRLEIKTKISVVEDFARRAGLAPGMRVVDVGCGPGLTTSALSTMVGESGSAVGIDISEMRIAKAREHHEDERTSFFVRDFLKPIDDIGNFDFAWMRFALEYFREQCFDIARNISSMINEGGILCLIDLDYNCLSHYGMSPRLEAAFSSAVHQLEVKANFDPYAGRKLYSHLYRLGYEDIQIEISAHHLIYGSLGEADRYNWGKKIEVLSRKFNIDLPGYTGLDEFYEDFMNFFHDPGRFTYTPVIAAWGRKGKEPR